MPLSEANFAGERMVAAIAALGRIAERQQEAFVAAREVLQAEIASGRETQRIVGEKVLPDPADSPAAAHVGAPIQRKRCGHREDLHAALQVGRARGGPAERVGPGVGPRPDVETRDDAAIDDVAEAHVHGRAEIAVERVALHAEPPDAVLKVHHPGHRARRFLRRLAGRCDGQRACDPERSQSRQRQTQHRIPLVSGRWNAARGGARDRLSCAACPIGRGTLA